MRNVVMGLGWSMLGLAGLLALPYPNYCAYCYANLNYWACIAAGCW